jgi:hypothetical protein
MRWGVVFCEVISQMLVSWSPQDMELTLIDSVFDPIKSHVHGMCVSLFNCVINVSCCNSGVGGCGYPISSNVVRKIVSSFALKKLILFLLLPLMTSHV